jgi:maleylacetoacetate isomerase
LQLTSYWRSSAAYRVRIALNLKGVDYDVLPVDLRAGVQRGAQNSTRHPLGLVPALSHEGRWLTQSLAIVEWLDETVPEPPLLPADPLARAEARALALTIACEIHPLNNTRVLKYLESVLDQPEAARLAWYRHWVAEGFAALERMLAGAGPFCVGDRPGLADVCLVPQVYNARRYDCPLDAFPTVTRIEQACLALPAFDQARPERQPDAMTGG